MTIATFRSQAQDLHASATALLQAGELAAARECLRQALRFCPDDAALYYTLSVAETFQPGDPAILAMEALQSRRGELPAEARIHLAFALAKAYADCGQPGRAFSQLVAGNADKRALTDYREGAVLALFGRLRDLAPDSFPDPDPALAAEAPTFIVGMPRSGSTLLEQILAAHPAVFAAGEVNLFGATVQAVLGPRPFPNGLRELKETDFAQIGAHYRAELRRLAPGKRVVNKLPENFLTLPLIRRALPEARLIHARRDPIDTCLSCFGQLFTLGQPFSYDLGELGRYYRHYAALMEEWRLLLPAGCLTEVDYESLVADPEAETRRLLRACGLPWDEACLSFHRVARPILTGSLVQVRRPIYRDSVGKWRPPAELLRPLTDGLAGLAVPAEAHNALAALRRAGGEEEAAAASLRRAASLRPDLAAAWNDLGALARDRGHLDKAVTLFRHAVALAPLHPGIHCNLGAALLQRGDFEEGWREHEWRLPPTPDPSLWQGQDLAGRTILLKAEQGLGDTLHFIRFAEPIAALGARVIVEAPPELVRLLATAPGIAAVYRTGTAPVADFHLPLMSAPHRLGTKLETIPAAIPYLRASAAEIGARQGLKVGLAWSGSPRLKLPWCQDANARRSVPPAMLAPLLAMEGVTFVSLQKDRSYADPRLLDRMEGIGDFAATAALVCALDLVITVDTAVAHLAGALGRPVWILSRFAGCWRWLGHRPDSPWYPTARLFHQRKPDDWQPVIDEVAKELRKTIELRSAVLLSLCASVRRDHPVPRWRNW